jgi:subtilisin
MTTNIAAAPELKSFLVSLDSAVGKSLQRVRSRGGKRTRGGADIEMRVIDSIHEDGAKLIEMSAENIPDLRASQPGMRIVPVVYYKPAIVPPPIVEEPVRAMRAAVSTRILLKIVSGKDKKPVAGANVIAFTDFAARRGAQGTTNKQGEVSLSLGASSKKLERLYIFAEKDFWGLLRKSVTIKDGQTLRLNALDMSYTDGKRFFYGDAPDQAGAGLTVGVIDTGIAEHPDLAIDGGANTVMGENVNDFGDNGLGHGTHVGGIIGARGIAPTGIRGIAPGVKLRSYRVFGKNKPGASNFAIAKAIDRAIADGCDLINMSLGGGSPDILTQEAIADARSQGVVIFAAAGNDSRSPVSFPASEAFALAVSAMGRKRTFPTNTTHTGNVATPYGKPDKKNFLASFTNIGMQLDLTGPGVGIISTYPGGYAAMDGTSMACPAATGIAARLLSKPANAALLAMTRDQARWDAMIQIILQSAKSLGFGPTFEGKGMILLD